MSGYVSINPYLTSSPYPTFETQTQGGIQGVPFDDTVSRMWLKQGTLNSSETVPMWGGRPVEVLVNSVGTGPSGIGPSIKTAVSSVTTSGWSTFYQMAHMVIVPGNSVPLIGINGSVGYFLNGTNTQLMVQITSALASAAAGGSVTGTTLYWNPTEYALDVTGGSNWALPTTYRLDMINTNGKVVSWSSPNATWATGYVAALII